MWTTLSSRSVSCHYLFVISITLLALLHSPAPVNAQQPTATIKESSGEVFVSIQGKEPVAAAVGTVLQKGDFIQTQAGAQVVLILSEGSELRLGQNTKIDLAALSQRPRSGARTSRIKLLYGRIRAFLSPGHQKEGSSFTVETPNAEAGVKFSRPVIEASYDPVTKTSVFKAYTVVLNITNRTTREIRQVPRGNEAIIQQDSISISPITSEMVPTSREELPQEPQPQQAPAEPQQVPAEPQPAPVQPQQVPKAPQQSLGDPLTSQKPQTQLGGSVMRQARSVVRGATSTSAPISVGTVGTGDTDPSQGTGGSGGSGGTGGTTTTETSTNPSPGTRPSTAENRTYHPVTITILTQ